MPLDRSWEAALTSPAASSPTLAAARHRRIRCGCCTITLTEPLLEHRCELTVLLTLFSLLPVPRWLTSDEGKSSPLSDVVVVVTFTCPTQTAYTTARASSCWFSKCSQMNILSPGSHSGMTSPSRCTRRASPVRRARPSACCYRIPRRTSRASGRCVRLTAARPAGARRGS